MQATEVQTINATQSLAAVQTMLKAGLGCITYLRNLLPEDHFTESYFTSMNKDCFSFSEKEEEKGCQKTPGRNINAFKIMTVMRGYSDEADKLLDHMECGIFEALQKQYLRRFVFGIHLDDTDPNNIVEAYTFDFKYHTVAGTGETVPIMTLQDEFYAMSLKPFSIDDPVANAVKMGKTPTVLDVKKSVKTLLRRLIQATTQMEALPQRRYATFKLIYNDSAPTNYEPPTFQTGDAEKNKWYFTTHSENDTPEKWNLGGINTGHHSVAVSVASVASYLPSATADNDATFLGTTSCQNEGISRHEVQQLARSEVHDQNMSNQRSVSWDADLTDDDAEADDDPDFISSANGSMKMDNVQSLRNDQSPSPILGFSQETQAPCFIGTCEPTPSCVADMNLRRAAVCFEKYSEELPATQVLLSPASQRCESSPPPVKSPKLPESDPIFSSFGASNDQSKTMDVDDARHEIDHGCVPVKVLGAGAEDDDYISQCSQTSDNDLVHTVVTHCAQVTDNIEMTLGSPLPHEQQFDIDHGLQCECEIKIEAGVSCIFCEGGCQRWFHTWCMGFHSNKDKRIPSQFKCFDCRVKADPLWELIKTDLYSIMLIKFKDLALFRRAIKIAQKSRSTSVAGFTKAMGCHADQGRGLLQRLESEGFITAQRMGIDEFGLAQTVKKGKGTRQEKTNLRTSVQKLDKYLFNTSSTKSDAYVDYFDSSEEVEARMLQLDQIKSQLLNFPNATSSLADHITNSGESQTQEETQYPFVQQEKYNRVRLSESPNDSERPKKKTKISVTLAVDLAE